MGPGSRRCNPTSSLRTHTHAPFQFTFSGIASFAHLKPVKCLIEPDERYDIAVIGAPFDTAVSYRPGKTPNNLTVCPPNSLTPLQALALVRAPSGQLAPAKWPARATTPERESTPTPHGRQSKTAATSRSHHSTMALRSARCTKPSWNWALARP